MSNGYETLEVKFVVREQATQIKAQAARIRAQAARIKVLEVSLRWIAKSCDERIHRLDLFDEIRDEALDALALVSED